MKNKVDTLIIGAEISPREVIRQAMLLMPYKEFAEMIATTVMASDDPLILMNEIKSKFSLLQVRKLNEIC